MEVEEKMKECDNTMASLRTEALNEAKEIDGRKWEIVLMVVVLAVTAPFLLEGDRIISMLTGPDLLRL